MSRNEPYLETCSLAPADAGKGAGPDRIAIIADDLTGALDSTAPFVTAGFAARVATSVEGAPALLQARSEVMCVSTRSRDAAAGAAGKVAHCARLFRGTDALQIKKIDSRLQGNVAAEIEAMMAVLACRRLLVLPAVPLLGRYVKGGFVVGAGVTTPISIADRLGALARHADIPECMDDGALRETVLSYLRQPNETLLAGASGMTAALANLSPSGQLRPACRLEAPMLFVIGSRDPVTRAQVDRLRRGVPGLSIAEAPNGIVATGPRRDAEAALLIAVAGEGRADPSEVSRRLAASAVRLVEQVRARTVVACGGETATAVLDALGVKLLQPEGEIARGIPWCNLETSGNRRLTFISKSGGFGDVDCLLDVCRLGGLVAAGERSVGAP